MSPVGRKSWFLIGGSVFVLAATAATVLGLGQLTQLKNKTGGQPSATVQPTQPISGPRVVQLDLNTYSCSVESEKLPLSDGDEPYLAVRTYWIDGNTVRLGQLSTATFRSKGKLGPQGNLARTHVRSTDAFGIPMNIGQYEDTLVPIAPAPGFPNGATPMVGVAIIGMEQDYSSSDASGVFLTDAFRKFDEEMIRAIRTRSMPDPAQLENSMRGFLGKRVLSVQLLNPRGAIDPDDVLGTSFKIWTLPEIEAAGARGVPFRMGLENDARLGYSFASVHGVVRIKSVPPPPRRDVILTIKQVRAVDDLEGFGRGDPDFQMRVVMDGRVFRSPEQSGTAIRPDWTFRVPALKPEIPISIELYERDGATSPDESCDISQVRGRKTLLLSFLVDKDVVSGDRRGRAGTEIVASGVGDSDRAEVAFTISQGR